MIFSHTTAPSEQQKVEMLELYNRKDNVSIIQNPFFPLNIKSSLTYFFFEKQNDIVTYCIVNESILSKLKFIKYATIYFGAIGNSEEIENELLENIVKFYKKSKFTFIYFQPFMGRIPTIFKMTYKCFTIEADKKATLLINLKAEVTSIEQNFSNHLKRNIRKGEKLELQIKEISSDYEIALFCEIHEKMSVKRDVFHYSKSDLKEIIDFIRNNNSGFLIGCYTKENVLIGGLIGLAQGNKLEYYIGATHPDYRHLPQSHLTHFLAIKKSKELGFSFYDFGGFGLNKTEEDQVFHINKFKLSFSNNIIEFVAPLEIRFSFIKKIIYLIYLKLANT